ncbi:MAG: hypothetical protein II399_01650 [Lachnospiraceae bacterium]|nr:hypothetical protein [Lachnospiraceae bacterium]
MSTEERLNEKRNEVFFKCGEHLIGIGQIRCEYADRLEKVICNLSEMALDSIRSKKFGSEESFYIDFFEAVLPLAEAKGFDFQKYIGIIPTPFEHKVNIIRDCENYGLSVNVSHLESSQLLLLQQVLYLAFSEKHPLSQDEQERIIDILEGQSNLLKGFREADCFRYTMMMSIGLAEREASNIAIIASLDAFVKHINDGKLESQYNAIFDAINNVDGHGWDDDPR